MAYNGLDNDLKTFAQFIFIYETRIKQMVRADEFSSLSSRAASFFKHKIQPKIKYATKDEIANQTDFTTKTLFLTKNKVQIIDFCRHLRNSFVHALMAKREPKVLSIPDIFHGRHTCRGFLDYKIVKEFVINIIRDYSESA